MPKGKDLATARALLDRLGHNSVIYNKSVRQATLVRGGTYLYTNFCITGGDHLSRSMCVSTPMSLVLLHY